MSDSDQKTGAEDSGERQMDFAFRYAGPSGVRTDESGNELGLVGNSHRGDVRLKGRLKNPLRFREALSVLYAVVGSDYRYVPKDRTAYLAYLRQQQSAPKKSAWEAQKAYFDWLQRNDPMAWMILDPIISVQPDGVFFEVFSKDESTYARLSVDWDEIEREGEPGYGTTNIDFSKGFFDSIQKMRGYRDTRINIGRDAVVLETEGEQTLEKQIKVPDNWLRAFLQVQSAATLPKTTLTIAPIDFYNVLRFLRFHKDQKGKGRGLRIELIPGEAPRLVLEPWEEVFETSAGIYKGRRSEVIRIWGRRRLMLLRRLLPFVESIDIQVLGSGLPSFYVFKAGPLKLTVGLSGWTAANWAQAASFDLMLPRDRSATGDLDKVLTFLKEKRVASREEIGAAAGLDGRPLTSALQLGCQQGWLMVDVDSGLYRFRALTDEPLDFDRLEFRNDRERVAHDLIAKDAVKIESENRIPGTGTEVVGLVYVEADQREYRTSIVFDDAGRVRKATCTSRFFRENRLKKGPSAPLIALCLAYAREQARRQELAKKGELRKTATIETRTYARRLEEGEEVFQVSLDRSRMKIRWGLRGGDLRVQNLVFNTNDQAREAYFSKIDKLESRGYLDATTGGVRS